MTLNEAKKQGFTHHARMYGISGYVKHDDFGGSEFAAKVGILDYLVEAIIYVDMLIPFNEYGFKILQGSKL